MTEAAEGRVLLERDLYRELVRFAEAPGTAARLKLPLEKLVALTGAERGFLELYRDDAQGEHRLAVTFGLTADQEEELRAVTSRGIVAASIAAGKTLHTPFALLDERFAKQPSVMRQRLEAVLCVPLPGLGPGVLYLEGRRGAGPFAAELVELTERVAVYLAPLLERAVSGRPVSLGPDPTLVHRAALRLEALAGRSPALASVMQQVALVAPHDIAVLLTGDSGTGKTHLARAIHENSPRRAGPFVELSCGAIPDGNFEPELFGAAEGAYTGVRRTVGKVEAAEGGTLFLDEIGELSLAGQAKLLQLLQSKQYYALGSSKLATANIRVIAATNADLGALKEQKRFREDLLYRINSFVIRVPALAERREDIQPLLEELLTRIVSDLKLPRLPLSQGFRCECEARDWPGNVRQLRSALEQAVLSALAEKSPQVEARHLTASATPTPEGQTFHEATRAFQREFLRKELNAAAWNVSEVGRRLDLSRSQLYAHIKALQLERESN